MHPMNGKWKILAKTPIGDMPSIDEITVSEDQLTFEGVMHDERSGKDYPITDGKINGMDVTFKASMKIGLIHMDFDLVGHINDDQKTCQGTAKAMMFKGTFEGTKIEE